MYKKKSKKLHIWVFFINNEGLKLVINWTLMSPILESLFVIISMLLAVAFVTVAERKTMASMQRRLGPNIVGCKKFEKLFSAPKRK
jgi:NADH:ubiquinone oxidoreductase subunit H